MKTFRCFLDYILNFSKILQERFHFACLWANHLQNIPGGYPMLSGNFFIGHSIPCRTWLEGIRNPPKINYNFYQLRVTNTLTPKNVNKGLSEIFPRGLPRQHVKGQHFCNTFKKSVKFITLNQEATHRKKIRGSSPKYALSIHIR
jgi:hypothetical protein